MHKFLALNGDFSNLEFEDFYLLISLLGYMSYKEYFWFRRKL